MAPRDGIGAGHHHQQRAADAPDLHEIGVGAAEHAVADPVDDDPDHQRDAGQDFVEDQPAVLADDDVAQAEHDNPADRPAPDVELVQHRLAEPAVSAGSVTMTSPAIQPSSAPPPQTSTR